MLDCTNQRHWRVQRLLNKLDIPLNNAQYLLNERQRVYREDNAANRNRIMLGSTQAFRDVMRVARRVDTLNARKQRLLAIKAETQTAEREAFYDHQRED